MKGLLLPATLLIALILFHSCSETSMLDSGDVSVFGELGKTERKRLDRAFDFIQQHVDGLMFLKVRALTARDMKYGLAQQMTYKGRTFLKIPVFRGVIVPGAHVIESLRETARQSVVLMFDGKDEILAVDFMDELPEYVYAREHLNELYYRNFVGDVNIYNNDNVHIGYAPVRKPCTRSITDSTFVLDEVEVTGQQGGGDSGWGDIPPGGGYNEGDGSFSPVTCPICGSSMNEGDPVCPRIAYHDSGSGGGNGGGDGSSEAGVYKRCMWDTVGINALNRAIVERIDCCKQLRMMKEDLAKRGRGFEDVILLA